MQINFSFTNVLDKSVKISVMYKTISKPSEMFKTKAVECNKTENVIFKDPLELLIILGIYLGVS